MRAANAKAAWGCVVAAALLASACAPSLTNGGLTCSSDGKCPPGFHCAANNTCWKDGEDPGGDVDLSVEGDLGDQDLSANGGPDLLQPADLTPTLTVGQLCNTKDDCISGFCADGVCCDLACTDNCKSCNQPNTLGTCTPLNNGSNPAHGTCGPDSTASCGRDGFCDGSGNCRKYGTSTVCLAASCNAGTNLSTPASKCNGAGQCQTPTPISCDPYVCNGTVCFASCTAPAQCKGGMPCNSNQCGPKSNGSLCTLGTECTSMNCVDGVCCNATQAACNGCKACNLASSLGTCADVPANNDPHGACVTNDTTCTAGGCNGAGACTPSANTVICSSTCGSTNQLTVKKCNGVSLGCSNAPVTNPCASNLVCRDLTSCAPNCSANGDADCLSTHYCSGGNCTLKITNGNSCSTANQCASGVCGSYHRDADGDTYGTAAVTKLCGATPPSGYVVDASDCCDADGNVHPTQTMYFPTAAMPACGANFFDYNCVSGAEPQFVGAGACTTSGVCSVSVGLSCTYTAGWSGAAPSCGNPGTYVNGCNQAAACTPCADPGSCGRGCAAAQTGSKTQACR